MSRKSRKPAPKQGRLPTEVTDEEYDEMMGDDEQLEDEEDEMTDGRLVRITDMGRVASVVCQEVVRLDDDKPVIEIRDGSDWNRRCDCGEPKGVIFVDLRDAEKIVNQLRSCIAELKCQETARIEDQIKKLTLELKRLKNRHQ